MPPFVGRKRRSSSPLPGPPPPKKRAKVEPKPIPKPTPKLQKKVSRFSLSSDSDSSSLSDVDSDEFEDIPQSSRPVKTAKQPVQNNDEDGDEDEDIEWEDAPTQSKAPDFSNRQFGDVKFSIDKDEGPVHVKAGAKKGPSKREKQTRMWAHQMHVQFLLWHNAKRNEWIEDQELQNGLVRALPSQITREIEKWKRASGLAKHEAGQPSPSKDRKQRLKKWKANGERNERDWGRPSQKLEEGKVDMSHGDPIISLLKILAAYWKKRYAITAPGLRKRGYGPRLALRKDIESYRTDKHHPAKHGEKIESLEHFRRVAESCEGSRDVGAQLFTALLRGIGIESRMVASLQPVGFGFTKTEEMIPRKIIDPEDSLEEAQSNLQEKKVKPKLSKKATPRTGKGSSRTSGAKTAPIDLDSDNIDEDISSDEEDSVVDVTPQMPKARPAKYDRDLLFPVYWTEAISPVTSKVYPVSFLLEQPVATSPETLAAFEPKGAKAEKTRQVMAYVVAHSSDFSAKDVTVRYLRKQIWPGKTKGYRWPVEKVPIYNTRGKIKRYEDYDWFKHVLGNYRKSDKNRTAVDDVEDQTDLVPAEAEKKQVEGDTLQSLKSSPDFVLERHLRREEALLPGAQPVRYFTVGKAEKREELPVYSRKDVKRVMTAESWHKEGRAPKEGEAPMKLAPVRAVTLNRKREAEEHLIRTGEKQMQGLYSQEQTDWIIPPPIQDGKIPKNSYGNIDCFVPSMVPKGAVHLPLKGSVRICKKLEVDFAEAVVGFEFGNKMAVPVIHGVVIAQENEMIVRDAWRAYNEEQKKKEETKMEKLVLELWRKFVIGLRVRDRVQEEYGTGQAMADLNRGMNKEQPIQVDEEDDFGGGFVPVGQDEGAHEGGFLVDHEEEAVHDEDLTFDNHPASQEQVQVDMIEQDAMDVDASQEYPTPVSASAISRKEKGKQRQVNEEKMDDSDASELSELSSQIQISPKGGDFLSDDESPTRAEVVDSKPKANDARGGPHIEKQKRAYKPKAKTSLREMPHRPGAKTKPSTNSTPKTRSTPARGAKSRVKNMNVDGASDTDEEGFEANDSDDLALTTSSRRNSSEGKTNQARERHSEVIPQKGKRLLRKESTVVTSPYFE